MTKKILLPIQFCVVYESSFTENYDNIVSAYNAAQVIDPVHRCIWKISYTDSTGHHRWIREIAEEGDIMWTDTVYIYDWNKKKVVIQKLKTLTNEQFGYHCNSGFPTHIYR